MNRKKTVGALKYKMYNVTVQPTACSGYHSHPNIYHKRLLCTLKDASDWTVLIVEKTRNSSKMCQPY